MSSHALAVAVVLVGAGTLVACDADAGSRERRPTEVPADPLPPSELEMPVYAPQAGPPSTEDMPEVVPAAHDDAEWGVSDPTPARRLVYRITLRIPNVLGSAPDTIPPAAAELFVDVSDERLRARFAGPGWPVEAGSEIRLRSDLPGVYVFDADGGRPVPPGQMARWFQGGPVHQSQLPTVGLRAPPPTESSGPGDLLCALLAEWSGQDRANLERRCSRGAPAMFRLGPWRGERTADVPVELPRSALRADHVDLPPAIPKTDSRAFMSPELLGRLEPTRRPRGPPEPRRAEDPAEGVRVRNQGATCVVMTAHGVPIGWVEPGATGHFIGLAPGPHLIAGMRPLGNLGYPPRETDIPAQITIRR